MLLTKNSKNQRANTAKIIFTSFIKIMKTNSISFKGINISNANLLGHKMSIYKLTQKDAPLIEKLGKEVDLKELIPNIDKNNFEIFNAILQGSFRHALDKNKHSMLLTCDDKPCGIMVNLNKTACHFVNYICTWPIEPDKKAPFGAQTLFEEMFKNFLNSQAKFIELYAIRFGDAISKYMRIGFTPRGGDNDVELMKISRAKVLESYKKLKERINLEPANNKEDIDLLKELKY